MESLCSRPPQALSPGFRQANLSIFKKSIFIQRGLTERELNALLHPHTVPHIHTRSEQPVCYCWAVGSWGGESCGSVSERRGEGGGSFTFSVLPWDSEQYSHPVTLLHWRKRWPHSMEVKGTDYKIQSSSTLLWKSISSATFSPCRHDCRFQTYDIQLNVFWFENSGCVVMWTGKNWGVLQTRL